MQEFCHTCGEQLPAGRYETPFCPNCGAPQLTLGLELQTQPPEPGPASTGLRPPPRPQQVDWRMAIQCALGVAGVGAALTLGSLRLTALQPASLLWLMSGSLITLGLYQNRRPAALMDARVGARIGIMVGLCLAFGVAGCMAVAGLVARFGLHSLGAFDAQMAMVQKAVVQSVLRQAQQSGTPVTPEAMQLLGSQEYRAVSMLVGCGMGAALLLAISAAAGAFGGMLRMRQRPAA